MIFTKENVILITMTVSIICHQLTAAVDGQGSTSDKTIAAVPSGFEDEASNFWVSGNDLDTQNNFFWSNGLKFSFNNWALNEPSSKDKEDCVEYILNKDDKKFVWNDQICTNKEFFVCEIVKN